MNHRDKSAIVQATAAPFRRLAAKVIGETSAAVAKKIFKERWNEEMAKFKDQCPNLHAKFGDKASHLYYKDLSGTNQSTPFINYKPICIPNLTGMGASNWNACDITLTEEMFLPEYADKIASWKDISRKLILGTALLEEWVEHFENAAQLPFSLPQLTPFLRQIDFRQRHKWGVEKPMFNPQKRPRIVVPPTMELKQYVTEASLLIESTKEVIL